MERNVAWNTYNETEQKELEQISAEYKLFLNGGKTEWKSSRTGTSLMWGRFSVFTVAMPI